MLFRSTSLDFSLLDDPKIVSRRIVAPDNNNLYIGTENLDANRYWDGDIAEIIVFDTILTDTNRTNVFQYIRDKYAPPVNLGSDIVVPYGYCDTIIVAETRFVDYLWSTGSTNDTIIVNKPGTYSVTVTDIFGFTSTDAINVIYPGNLSPFNDTTICSGDTLNWATGLDTLGYSFLWSNGSTASQIAINIADSYYVQITDTTSPASCIFQTDTLAIVIDTFPDYAGLGSDTGLCKGNTIGLATGSNETVSYIWSTSSTDTFITIDSTSTYSVTVTNQRSCKAYDTIAVTVIGIAPTVSFNFDSIFILMRFIFCMLIKIDANCYDYQKKAYSD